MTIIIVVIYIFAYIEENIEERKKLQCTLIIIILYTHTVIILYYIILHLCETTDCNKLYTYYIVPTLYKQLQLLYISIRYILHKSQ